METWITSNLHFGREKLAYKKGFNSVNEMNQIIIDNWNNQIGYKDNVYILGNIAWSYADVQNLLLLNGNLKIIAGQNDQAIKEFKNDKPEFERITILNNQIEYIKHSDFNFILSYWPLFEWLKNNNKKNVHLYGYELNNKKIKEMPKRSMCVSIHYWKYLPLNLNDVKSYFENL